MAFCFIKVVFATQQLNDSEIVEQIYSVPSWGGLDKSHIKDYGDKIFARLYRFVALPETQALDVMQETLNKAKDTEEHARIVSVFYVLNRLYFDIPTSLKAKDMKLFGGVYLSGDINSRLAIWPLSCDSNGNMAFSDTYNIYCGPVYDVISEFNYFSKKFNRRKFINHHELE